MSRNGSRENVARFQFETVEIDGGWSGRVLTDWQLEDGLASTSSVRPSLDDWRRMLITLVTRPDTLPGRVDLKRSRTAQVFRTHLSGLEVVCKRGEARRWLRESRERKNWNRAFGLLGVGVRTPLPRVLLERRQPAEAWFVAEAVPDAVDLDGVMWWQIPALAPAEAARAKRAMAERVAELCLRMRSRGVFHRDFKASNVLVTGWDRADGDPMLWLVDLDGVRLRQLVSGRAYWRAVTRMAASLAECNLITLTDRVRFVRALSADAGDEAWKAAWRRLAADVATYNRRSRARKQGKLDGFLGE